MEELDIKDLIETFKYIAFKSAKLKNTQIISLLENLNGKEKQEFKRIVAYLDFIEKGKSSDGFILRDV
jgi:hypothetical protein